MINYNKSWLFAFHADVQTKKHEVAAKIGRIEDIGDLITDDQREQLTKHLTAVCESLQAAEELLAPAVEKLRSKY